jgi:hypothetical protein
MPLPSISLSFPFPTIPSTPLFTQVDCFGGKINEQTATATVIAQRDCS